MSHNPVTIETGPSYQFHFNEGTQLGELWAGNFRIPMREFEAVAFHAADAATRQQLVLQYVRAQEARGAQQRKSVARA